MTRPNTAIPTPEEGAPPAQLQSEWDALNAEEKTIRERLKTIEARRGVIRDWRDLGLLPHAVRQLIALRTLARDAQATTVRVALDRNADPQDPTAWRPCVIDTNGPKRAVLREQYKTTASVAYHFPSRHYVIHPEDRHLLRIYGAKEATP